MNGDIRQRQALLGCVWQIFVRLHGCGNSKKQSDGVHQDQPGNAICMVQVGVGDAKPSGLEAGKQRLNAPPHAIITNASW